MIDDEESLWKLYIPYNNLKITFPVISNLYKLGMQKELLCGNISSKSLSDMKFDFEFKLYTPGSKISSWQLINKNETGYFIDYDFPGLVYWMLARCEEIGVDEKYLDKHLRFCSFSSHSEIYKYNEHPIIDYWFILIKRICGYLYPKMEFKKIIFKYL